VKPVASHDAFDRDVRDNRGYLYTTNARRSSVVANERLTTLTCDMVALAGRRVIDVGCGDGTYAHALFVRTRPACLVGVDAAAAAVAVARERYGAEALRFEVHDVHAMPYAPHSFDVAVVRGLLHHLDDPRRALTAIARLAGEVLVIEPNGYNPVLKVIERVSRYHRAHGERSYAPARLRGWIRGLGGVVERERYAGLVPFFCPDWMVGGLKRLEPWVERTLGVARVSCAVFAVRFRTSAAG
jgi:SAM-dependent methyltransferase